MSRGNAGHVYAVVTRPAFFDDPRRACADMGTDLFFPEARGEKSLQAKAICRRCPFRQRCAEYGIAHELYGTFGGLTADERDAIRKGRRAA